MRNYYIAFIAMLSFAKIIAQSNHTVTLHFLPLWKSEGLILSKPYPTADDTITISQLKFYISHIQLYKDDSLVWVEKESYHLIDHESESAEKITLSILPLLQYNKIRFLIGIDSLTQNDGVKGGDLDPTKGMYWTWQSGYIHFKLEGNCRKCNARKNEFQFHIGGYSAPFNSIQSVEYPITLGKDLEFGLDLSAFLAGFDLPALNHIMSPSAKAVEIAKSIRFSTKEQ
ncbi:MAG: MbnP family protein [Saprospiraceae bacterium]